jgi:hypothetical protein
MSRPNLPPSLSIVLSFEAPAPRIINDAAGELEASRLSDWICSQPDLCELLDRALQIRERHLREQERDG